MAPKGEKKPKSSPKPKREKKEKREGEPKRPASAWLLWLKDNRERVKNEGYGGKETLGECGRQWKELSESDKQPYVDQAKDLKEEYKQAMDEFEATQ